MPDAALPEALEAGSLALLSVHSSSASSSLELSDIKKSSSLRSKVSSSLAVSSKSFPFAAASMRLSLICLRHLFLFSTISRLFPPTNNETYFSFFGKNLTYSRSSHNFDSLLLTSSAFERCCFSRRLIILSIFRLSCSLNIKRKW
uniref:Uncharacterized protein n=1 Tax=Arundo donax TaxID=35708 RepID=A0A0A9DBM0_ARUDO